MDIKIEVKLFGVLRRYRPEAAGGAPHHPFFVMMASGATVEMLLQTLDMADDMVNATAVNQESVDHTQIVLRDGDQVSFFPPTAGG